MATTEKATNDGKTWAALSYAGLLVGLPLGLLVLGRPSDGFARFHARCSLVVWLQLMAVWTVYTGLFVCSGIVSAFTAGVLGLITIPMMFLLTPMVFVPWLPALHGLLRVSRGESCAPFGTFGLADRLFPELR